MSETRIKKPRFVNQFTTGNALGLIVALIGFLPALSLLWMFSRWTANIDASIASSIRRQEELNVAEKANHQDIENLKLAGYVTARELREQLEQVERHFFDNSFKNQPHGR